MVLLAEEARHGYTLLEELEKLGLKDLHPSKVYRTLRMMEDDLWIISDWDADETQGPPRRVYRLTDEGEGRASVLAKTPGKKINRWLTKSNPNAAAAA